MQNIWFPYFSLQDEIPPLKVKTSRGSRLILEDGRELVDGISSWWSVCHGYNHPYILEKMKLQLETLSHVMFGGITHEPAELLSKKLVHFINDDLLNSDLLSRVFFSDSGSTAVEVALKMAMQYFYELGLKDKNKIIYFENGYHGETLGALSVSDSMNQISVFPLLQNKILFKIPTHEEEFIEFENRIDKCKEVVAGAIIEPLLQGAGCMRMYDSKVVLRIWQILKKYNILIIADECATGFYRTGSKFAFQKVGFKPDILILGKALTAGYIPFAATIAKEFIFERICGKSRFFHGPTFMANPLAASAAIANIDIFEGENYFEKVQNIEKIFKEEFKNMNARVMGAVCALEISKAQVLKIKKSVANGETNAFLRPFGTVLYSMPPLNIEEKDLLIIIEEMKLAIDKI